MRPGVAPHVGAWIETPYLLQGRSMRASLPTWERGLKPIAKVVIIIYMCVAPHVGAWIETCGIAESIFARSVAPHVGAWIETCMCVTFVILTNGRSPRGSVD